MCLWWSLLKQMHCVLCCNTKFYEKTWTRRILHEWYNIIKSFHGDILNEDLLSRAQNLKCWYDDRARTTQLVIEIFLHAQPLFFIIRVNIIFDSLVRCIYFGRSSTWAEFNHSFAIIFTFVHALFLLHTDFIHRFCCIWMTWKTW